MGRSGPIIVPRPLDSVIGPGMGKYEVADCGPTRVGRESQQWESRLTKPSKDVPAMAEPGFRELYFVEQLS